MKLLTMMVALAGLSLALPACEYKPQSKADLLTESGFKVLSLNTPAKAASFKKLPPHRLTLTTFKGKQVWVYPDRNVCGCLYVGSQTAYKTYIAKATQQEQDVDRLTNDRRERRAVSTSGGDQKQVRDDVHDDADGGRARGRSN